MNKKLTSSQQESRKLDLKLLYQQKGISHCELKLPFCTPNWTLAFAHRSKRIVYANRPEELWSFQETILACTNCHQLIEGHSELTRVFFRKLRP